MRSAASWPGVHEAAHQQRSGKRAGADSSARGAANTAAARGVGLVMSRAVMQESFGGPEVLQVRDVAEPHAGPGEVRVRVSAAGLNPVDWKIAASAEAAGRYGVTLPAGFGNDFAGVVAELLCHPAGAAAGAELLHGEADRGGDHAGGRGV